MNRLACAAIAIVTFCTALYGQQSQNPVMDSVRQTLERQQKSLVAAAEAMPPDKYNFRPTSQQMTFGALVAHTVESNNVLCSRIGDLEEPKQGEAKLKETDPKDKLLSALENSFKFCTKALSKADDSKLGAQVKVFGGRQVSRAAAAISLTNGWADHYGMAAMYLRLNGLLPPTAKK
jgi:uncharacterized damage-inducible protein DinB